MRLTKIEIDGFRRLEHVELSFEGLSVLIGPNGVGKSTVLDVFVLLAEAMNGRLSEAIANRGGLDRLLSRFSAPKLSLRLESEPVVWPASTQASPLVYEIELTPIPRGYAIAHERLTQDRGQPEPFRYIDRRLGEMRFSDPNTGKLEKPTWNVDRDELALAQVPRTYDAPEKLRESLSATRAYVPILLDARSPLRLSQTLRPNVFFPSPTGEDLLSALYQLRAKEPDDFERFTDALRAVFPAFQKLDFEVVGAGQFALSWYEEGFVGPLYANELSSGTLRFLHLAATLMSPHLPPILVLDEPELSFHPEMLRIFAELLSEAGDSKQLIVATHSAPLVKWLEPAQIVVAQRSEDGTRLIRGDALHLERWLEKYTLDQLWQMNVIEADA